MLNATNIVVGGDRAQVFIVELHQRLIALSAHRRRQCLSLPQVASISNPTSTSSLSTRRGSVRRNCIVLGCATASQRPECRLCCGEDFEAVSVSSSCQDFDTRQISAVEQNLRQINSLTFIRRPQLKSGSRIGPNFRPRNMAPGSFRCSMLSFLAC